MERPPWQDAWEGFLDWLTNIVTPSWGDLIPVMPMALVALIVAVLAFIALRWRAHADRNRSRVPRRRVVAPPPPGVHLPGPSIWPFVLPIAGAFLFAALAFRPRNEQGQFTDPLNWPLLLVGLVIGLVGVIGWGRDAMREWRRLVGTEDSGSGVEDTQGTLEEWRVEGERTCAAVYGPLYDKLRRNIRAMHPALDAWMVVDGYGKVLSRPGLDLGRRELCIIAACAASAQERQLHSHLRGALNVGIAPRVVEEALAALEGVVNGEQLRSAQMLWARIRGK